MPNPVAQYLIDTATGLKNVIATYISTGAADGGKIIATDPATGKMHGSMLPPGVGPEIVMGVLATAVTAGDFGFRRASDSKLARASADVGGSDATGFFLDSGAIGDTVGLYTGRGYLNTAVSNLTPNTRYYLSATTPGGVTPTPPTGSGQRSQYVGTADAAGVLPFVTEITITRA